ncbi:MAG: sensor histidine kinase [Mycobacteriales bacterium]
MTVNARRWIPPFHDVVVAIVALVIFVSGSHGAAANARHYQPDRHAADTRMYVLVAIAAIALAARTVAPLVSLGVVGALVVVYLAIQYPYGPVMLGLGFAVLNAGYRLRFKTSAVAAGVTLVAVMVPEVLGGHHHRYGNSLIEDSGTLAAWSGVLLLPWVIGVGLKNSREHRREAKAQEARHRADEERLQIAREVHDVVAHGLAVINMQAGVALHVLERKPEQSRIALEAIKGASKAALDDLRATLAVLRKEGTAPRAPLAGLEQLPELTQAMATNGLPVTLTVSGDPRPIPSAVDLAAYRIVQESLTNVMRHAGPARAAVEVRYADSTITVEVTDNGAGAPAPVNGSGHGIAGMRERAEALGGAVDAGPRPQGGFRVFARLPTAESTA